MSKSTGRLSLGALPRVEVVNLTISMPAELKAQLDAYAEVHARLHGPVNAATLIPHMLRAFIARDRGFKTMRRKASAAVA